MMLWWKWLSNQYDALDAKVSRVPWEILLRKNEKNIIFDKSFIHDAELGTVVENKRKSLTQHCERSELRLQKWTKVDLKCQKWSILASFWKPEPCTLTKKHLQNDVAKAWQSWESYHRINIRQKTMIMLMMPVISTLLHHRLRARSLFEECAWGFSFREKSRGTYPPSTRDKFFDEFFWQGTKILVWKIHLILFIFISF